MSSNVPLVLQKHSDILNFSDKHSSNHSILHTRDRSVGWKRYL